MTIQRVLVAPLNYSHRQRGQVESFEYVFGKDNVREFDWYAAHREGKNAGALLAAHAATFRPDWIWIQAQGGEGLDPVRVQQIRDIYPTTLITHWMGDCRAAVPEQLAKMCQATHVTLLSNTGQFDMYMRAGAGKVGYVQIGLDPEDLPGGTTWEPDFTVPDVVFIGNHYGHVEQFGEGTELRLRAIRTLRDRGVDVGVVGSGWPDDIRVVGQCHVKQQTAVYRRAKVALSINHFNNIERYYSDRQLIAMASGIPVVCKRVPGMEMEFDDGINCLMFEGITGMVAMVEELLRDEGYRNRIGKDGQWVATHEHTWIDRIVELKLNAETWRRQLCQV